jgi:hypothetical protein
MPLVLAATSGSTIFVVAVVLIILGLVVGLYSRRGNAISEHPSDGRGEAPGADRPSQWDGHDRDEHVPVDHGTR